MSGYRSALYRGRLSHARRDRYAERAFWYPVYFASIDLDELPQLHRDLRLFSHNRRNLFSLRDRDYEAGRQQLAESSTDVMKRFVWRHLAANGIPQPTTTRLVTNLAVAGYVFNPVSFFVNYDDDAVITSVIAEVNNTYGGRFLYLLHQGNRRTSEPDGFRHPREFFVSPFLHGDASYDFEFRLPLDGAQAIIQMDVTSHDQPVLGGSDVEPDSSRVFVAHLQGARINLSDRALASAAALSPLMPMQIISLIHLQAMKLRRLGVPYLLPKSDHRPRAWPQP
jgi:uncharacterized protein